MGLLTFLSKKSHSDLKTSAYDATVASSPPIRGTYPVLGNGSKILEEFQKSHPNLVTRSYNNTPASSPLVSQFRRDGLHGPGVERPRTAPSSQFRETAGSLVLPLEPAPPLPPLLKKKYGPYKLTPKITTDIRASSVLVKPAPSPGLVSLYPDSIRSSESGKPKGYVDLLDAHSMIKPSNFYGRVQAIGAKNYGEDVADRNKEEKGSTLDITKAQVHSNHGGGWTAVISKDVDDDCDDEPPRLLRIRHSKSSGLRPKNTSSHSSDSFPKRTSSRLPRHDADETPKVMTRTASARSERAARRRSMPSFLASAPGEVLQSSSAGRGGKEEDPGLFPDSLRGHTRSATTHEREYVKPNISTKRQSLASSHFEHSSRPKCNDLDKPLPALPTSSKNHSKRRTISHNNSAVEPRLLAKRQSLHGIRYASHGEIYEDTYQQKVSLQGAQPPRDRNSARRQLASTTDLQDSFYNSPAQQSDEKSQIISSPVKCTDDKWESSQSNYLREQNIISLSDQSIMARETGTPIPERTSSLHHCRQESLTSETAMSTLSSNLFRPQSGHTTGTSIDFSPMFPRPYSNESIPPVPDIPFLKPLQSMPKNTAATPSPTRSPSIAHRRQSNELFLEYYASSLNRSSPSLSRGSYEKDLLFSDTGYGVSGDQVSGLPGLFDAAESTPSAGMSISQSWENEIHNVPRQFDMPAYLETDSNDSLENRDQTDSSDEELNFDIPMSRAGSALHYTQAQERFPERRQPLEEEDDNSDY
ncbi:hypothetical protein E0Z10_g9274 [Xylaria hypoxylon]|uniref:Uncharacterized protein n=1 Tax=Xylaria hypoxylon TaxID=37992 RepID=A0A4Z0Y6P9_9PEZI|nr:hypothetical protein E0Z10_g9274 [Xylaria hypoxylon]